METYRLLRGLLNECPNFELGINSVFCSENQEIMDDLIRSIRSLDGIRTHTVSLIRGDVEDKPLREVDGDRYERIAEHLASNLRTRVDSRYRFSGSGLKAAQDILQRRLIHRTLREKTRVVPCYAGKLTTVVTENGECYPCESFSERMGNVRDFGCDIKKLLKSEQAQKAVMTAGHGNCHCTHECYMMMNILFNPLLYPALVREYLKLIKAPRFTRNSFPKDHGRVA
jgi:radical SAM protein with 4Fe4S-binding SPASM domain